MTQSLFGKDGQVNKDLAFEQQTLPQETDKITADHYCGKEIFRMRNTLSRKFEAGDVRQDAKLANTAEWFTRDVYNGRDEQHWAFRYMRDMQLALAHYGNLTAAQAKGVLNVMYSEFKNFLADRHKRQQQEGVNEQPASVATRQQPNGYYTVVEGAKHWTIRLRDDFRKDHENSQVAGILVGPDNTSSYANFAFVENGRISYWHKAKGWNLGPFTIGQAWKDALEFLLRVDAPQREYFQQMYAKVSGNCYVCGRLLTDPLSIELGIGPICRTK